jgi:hypothetical protein
VRSSGLARVQAFGVGGQGATGVILVVLANAPRLRGTATSGGELGRGQRRDYCSCALRPHLSCATHTCQGGKYARRGIADQRVSYRDRYWRAEMGGALVGALRLGAAGSTLL